MKEKIENNFGEKIDVLIEGNQYSNKTIIFVHGFGTNKHEGNNLFKDISEFLSKDFRVVRFDFTGYGESDGKQEDVNFNKQAEDLRTVLNWTRKEFKGEVYIIAHSMGNFVTSLLSPDGIRKTVFSGIPNANTDHIVNFLQERIKSKSGVVNEGGISFYPRSSGEKQKVGPSFWKALRGFNPGEAISGYAQKTELLIIHPLQDEIVGNKYLDVYKNIPEVKYIEPDGDHNYSKREDRERVIQIIKDFLSS